MLLEAARDAGIRHLQVSTDEVYGSIEAGSFTEASPLEPSSPVLGLEGRRRPDRRRLSPHLRRRRADRAAASNNYGPRQHPEKLIPLCILNALAGDPLPVYGDGMQVRNWLYVEDFCAAIDLVLERGEAGEAYNVGGPDELPNIEVVRMILELTGRDESLIEHVTDRPGHDRRYSLVVRQGPRRSAGRPRVASTKGLRRTVDWYRDNEWWWEPIRSGEYRDYYERQYGTGARADGRAGSRPQLDGLVLIEPEVHGDERGFLVETFRDDDWRELGVDGASSCRTTTRAPGAGTLRGLHFQTTPGQAKLVRCLRGRIWDVAVDLRRDSPTFGRWEGHELDDERHRQLFVPVGFAHGFCVLSDVADVAYKLSSYYDPATEAGIAWDDPEVGVEWPIADPLLSERDRRRRASPRSPTRCPGTPQRRRLRSEAPRRYRGPAESVRSDG